MRAPRHGKKRPYFGPDIDPESDRCCLSDDFARLKDFKMDAMMPMDADGSMIRYEGS